MKAKWPCLVALTALFYLPSKAATPPVELKAGMIINSSVVIKKTVYSLNGQQSVERSVILIQGNNITVDFNGSTLFGSNNKQWPNEFYGLAILVKGNHITIKNARIHGYKIAIRADSCNDLVIENCDASYNYRPGWLFYIHECGHF